MFLRDLPDETWLLIIKDRPEILCRMLTVSRRFSKLVSESVTSLKIELSRSLKSKHCKKWLQRYACQLKDLTIVGQFQRYHSRRSSDDLDRKQHRILTSIFTAVMDAPSVQLTRLHFGMWLPPESQALLSELCVKAQLQHISFQSISPSILLHLAETANWLVGLTLQHVDNLATGHITQFGQLTSLALLDCYLIKPVALDSLKHLRQLNVLGTSMKNTPNHWSVNSKKQAKAQYEMLVTATSLMSLTCSLDLGLIPLSGSSHDLLPTLTMLQALKIRNQTNNASVAQLKHLRALYHLEVQLEHPHFVDGDPLDQAAAEAVLEALTNLQHLDLPLPYLSTVSSLSLLTQLTYLSITEHCFQSIEFLMFLEHLRHLHLVPQESWCSSPCHSRDAYGIIQHRGKLTWLDFGRPSNQGSDLRRTASSLPLPSPSCKFLSHHAAERHGTRGNQLQRAVSSSSEEDGDPEQSAGELQQLTQQNCAADMELPCPAASSPQSSDSSRSRSRLRLRLRSKSSPRSRGRSSSPEHSFTYSFQFDQKTDGCAITNSLVVRQQSIAHYEEPAQNATLSENSVTSCATDRSLLMAGATSRMWPGMQHLVMGVDLLAQHKELAAEFASRLASMQHLKEMHLYSSFHANGIGFIGVSAFTSCEVLDMSGCETVCPGAFQYMTGLNRLTKLLLNNSHLGDHDIQQYHRYSRRRRGCTCSDCCKYATFDVAVFGPSPAAEALQAATIQALAQLVGLRHLEMKWCRVSSAVGLSGLFNLTCLKAGGNFFDSDTLRALSSLTQLKHLVVGYAVADTDEQGRAAISCAVEALVRLTCLSQLTLSQGDFRSHPCC